MSIKVRFAPSPTGFMHIGNARIAIINYLFCRKNNGQFLFRIDDTDVQRSTREYEDAIREDLQWLGILYDETFRQSERLDRYKTVMNELIERGILYECFETPEELEYKRKLAIGRGKAPVYDRASLKLSDTEKAKLRDTGVESYWRFKLPEAIVTWNDLILGEISYDLRSVSDPVIIKADGTFLYTFSSVIDDIDSGITHIIRGQDHVTNTAVQIAMFNEIYEKKYNVQFAHLSLLVNKDGSQFSKRLGSLNLRNIRDMGVDPMAIANLMATLGSSLDTKPFSKYEDLIEYFDITKFSTNSPKFDIDDILNLNKKILHTKTFEEVKCLGLSEKAFELVRENISNYKEFEIWKNVFSNVFVPQYKPEDDAIEVLNIAECELENVFENTENSWKNYIDRIKEQSHKKGKDLYMPLRMAISDMEHGPNLPKLFEFLGKAEVSRRLKEVLRL